MCCAEPLQLYIDSANPKEVESYYKTGLIDGVTTNPSLMLKSGRKPEDVYQYLYDLGIKDISMEVVGDEEDMISEGKKLVNRYPGQATIKVPCTVEGLEACRVLALEHIRVNVTLVFSAAQAILAAKAGAYHVSPFVGRLDDNSVDGIGLIREIAEIYDRHNIDTHILAASIRDVKSVTAAFAAGANICTIPGGVFEGMYNHVLTDKGMDRFNKDWAIANTLATVG